MASRTKSPDMHECCNFQERSWACKACRKVRPKRHLGNKSRHQNNRPSLAQAERQEFLWFFWTLVESSDRLLFHRIHSSSYRSVLRRGVDKNHLAAGHPKRSLHSRNNHLLPPITEASWRKRREWDLRQTLGSFRYSASDLLSNLRDLAVKGEERDWRD